MMMPGAAAPGRSVSDRHGHVTRTAVICGQPEWATAQRAGTVGTVTGRPPGSQSLAPLALSHWHRCLSHWHRWSESSSSSLSLSHWQPLNPSHEHGPGGGRAPGEPDSMMAAAAAPGPPPAPGDLLVQVTLDILNNGNLKPVTGHLDSDSEKERAATVTV
jgi:hypothetical protein